MNKKKFLSFAMAYAYFTRSCPSSGTPQIAPILLVLPWLRAYHVIRDPSECMHQRLSFILPDNNTLLLFAKQICEIDVQRIRKSMQGDG
ncbi:hypothetical protein ACP26L_18120 [Paenibacillus sp. S-38]|uniref:hypothetical protein n=1 Tax=Paenibacillus sp. S-38 TaxID=3416710 RepID=UPI003CF595A3